MILRVKSRENYLTACDFLANGMLIICGLQPALKPASLKIKFIVIFLLAIFTPSALKGAETSAPIYTKVDAILRDWKSGPPPSLRDPANLDLIAALRRHARESSDTRARVILLDLQDPEIVQLCLNELHDENRPYNRGWAAKTFALCNEPQLIRSLVDDLNRDEGLKSRKLAAGEEVIRITPVSVLVTRVIQGIVACSPQFNQSVKSWAAALPTHTEKEEDRENARTAVRMWWSQNESLLRAKQYAQVQPPN